LIIQKENSHVVDNHRNSINPVAAWLFWPEYQSKLPSHRQLDPYPDRYRRHTRHLEPASRYINIKHVDEFSGSVADGADLLPLNFDTTCHPVDTRVAMASSKT
jgi:hypothetical protein